MTLRDRERALLGVAISRYDKLAKGTKANLESLALPTFHVDTARGNIEAIKTKLGQTSGEVEITDDLRITIKDAIDFAITKYVKAEDEQTELLIGTSETEETMNEVRVLRRKFAGVEDLGELAAAARMGAES